MCSRLLHFFFSYGVVLDYGDFFFFFFFSYGEVLDYGASLSLSLCAGSVKREA